MNRARATAGLATAWDHGDLVVYDRDRPSGRARLRARTSPTGSTRLADYAAEGLRCARLLDVEAGATVGRAGGSAVSNERLEELAAVWAAELAAGGTEDALRGLEAELDELDELGRVWRADAVRARDGGWLLLLRCAEGVTERRWGGLLPGRRRMDPAAAAAAEAQSAEQAPAVLAAAGWSWEVATESNLTDGPDGWQTTSWCAEELLAEGDPRRAAGWRDVVKRAISESVSRAEDRDGPQDATEALAYADDIERWLDEALA